MKRKRVALWKVYRYLNETVFVMAATSAEAVTKATPKISPPWGGQRIRAVMVHEVK